MSAVYYIFIDAKNHQDAYFKLTSDEQKSVQYIEDEYGEIKTYNDILGKKVLIKL